MPSLITWPATVTLVPLGYQIAGRLRTTGTGAARVAGTDIFNAAPRDCGAAFDSGGGEKLRGSLLPFAAVFFLCRVTSQNAAAATARIAIPAGPDGLGGGVDAGEARLPDIPETSPDPGRAAEGEDGAAGDGSGVCVPADLIGNCGWGAACSVLGTMAGAPRAAARSVAPAPSAGLVTGGLEGLGAPGTGDGGWIGPTDESGTGFAGRFNSPGIWAGVEIEDGSCPAISTISSDFR